LIIDHYSPLYLQAAAESALIMRVAGRPVWYNQAAMQKEPALEQNNQKVARVVKKVRLSDQPSDFTYWQSRPYAERLAVLEQIRREYINWKYGSEPGFQRIYTIVKR
jgi:hypothetical protein